MANINITQQRGSVMLESLIAILIFSLGILSLVALLGASVKNTTSAAYRTQASLLASQVIGQMWAGDKSNAALLANFDGHGPQSWQDNVKQALPGVVVATAPTISVAPDSTVTVTIFWRAPGDSDVHKHVTVARITSSVAG